jgi:D-glucuronyl C5-epimerase C-terminus
MTGPWIRLYSFSALTVLNAQLQAIVSLQDYATATGDTAAASLAAQLEESAIALLPRFDTGYWSLYSLGGDEAPLDYHKFVVRLLTTLAKRTGDETIASYAQRFGDDLREPPLVKTGSATSVIYPWPADGYRDTASFRIWVSKRSTIRLAVDDAPKPFVVSRGWHWISWAPGKLDPGTYTPALRAIDVVGNVGDSDLPSVEVKRDTDPPHVSASLTGRRLSWRGKDDASPWLTLRLVVRGPSGVKAVTLRHVGFRGSAVLPLTRGSRALLFAADSSGNTTLVVLR